MIRINLTPFEELENPLWWVPDVILGLTIALVGFFGVQFYLQDSKKHIKQLNFEIQSLNQNIASLQADVKEHDELDKKIKDLDSKLNSLQSLATSKIIRYQPIIVIEHLQNLRPQGVWFTGIKFVTEKPVVAKPTQKRPGAAKPQAPPKDGAYVEVEGHAFDNLLLAEFISALRATQNQELDPTDIRTLMYFSEVHLIDSILENGDTVFEGPATATLDEKQPVSLDRIPKFSLKLRIEEGVVKTEPAAVNVSLNFGNKIKAL